ncbi:hypothetical protein GCM10010302_42840 [Streptomyces polychromogenes]|uniref:Secreted protein n=1 Tax=Streptomyces polychromogenes TaxID=67342 RepID=A0ABN0VGP5_9ACTN
MKNRFKMWSARLAAATVVVAGATLVPATSASAATPRYFTICNNGSDFTVQAEFPPAPGDFGWKSSWLNKGYCSLIDVQNKDQRVVIRARNASGQTYQVAKFTFPAERGVDVKVRGSYGSVITARS